MNIFKLLKSVKSSCNLMYYGKNDMASGFQIKTLVDSYDDIEKYYNGKNREIKTLDDYIDYIFLDSFSKLKEVVPIVRKDLQTEVLKKIEDIKLMKENYKISDVNNFIKSNYKTILSRKELKKYDLNAYEIIEYSLNYIKSNYQYFKDKKNFELYEYIVKNYAYKIFPKIEEYKPIFSKYPQLEVELFSKDIIEGQMATKVELLKDALMMLKKDNKELYNASIETISNMVKSRAFNANIENVTYTYNDIKETMQLFKGIGENVLFDEFKEELKRQKVLLNEYIEKNGHHMKYEINLQEVLKALDDPKLSWEIKSLMITHTRIKQKMCSRIQSAIESKVEPSFLDRIASTNIDVNEYFTYSTQSRLNITILLGEMMIKYMLLDDAKFKELLNYMFAGVANYIEKNGIEIPNVDDDFNMFSFALKNLLLELQKEEKDMLVCEYWNFSALNLGIGIIEKVLREICYKSVIVNKYIPYNNLSIESILSLPEVEKFLGQANIRTMRFYLTSFDSVGKNLRNDICHHNNNLKEICSFNNVLIVIYLMLTMSNELLLKVIPEK